jgi:hypothetical protein
MLSSHLGVRAGALLDEVLAILTPGIDLTSVLTKHRSGCLNALAKRPSGHALAVALGHAIRDPPQQLLQRICAGHGPKLLE